MDTPIHLAVEARRVPTFDAEGARIRAYSEERARNLAALGRMVVFENRHGEILWAQFLQPKSYRRPASKPKYKLVQAETQLPGAEACSALFAVPLDVLMARDRFGRQTELARFQRAIFQQVLLSTNPFAAERMKEKKVKEKKVVSIDSHKHYQRSRPKPERHAA